MSPTAPRKTRPATKKAAQSKAPAKPVQGVVKAARTTKSTSIKKSAAVSKTSAKTTKVTRKPVGKVAASKKAGPTKATPKKLVAKKKVANKATANVVAKRAPVVKKAASKVAKTSATTGGRVASKSPAAKPKPAPVSQLAKEARVKSAEKPISGAREAPKKRAASPAIAKRHFLEVLEAKQERVRQGPSYPAANAFTGRIDAAFEGSHHVVEDTAPVVANTPSPEATYGAALVHARGNQGMRKQR